MNKQELITLGILPGQYLRELCHGSTNGHQQSETFTKLSTYICSASPQEIRANSKLFARIVCFYMKKIRADLSQESERKLASFAAHWRRQIKAKAIIMSNSQMYAYQKLSKFQQISPITPSTPILDPQIKNRGPQKLPPLEEQPSMPVIHPKTNDILLEIVRNRYHLADPSCLDCSEYYDQGDIQFQYKKLSICEGSSLPETGQFCMAVGLANNPTFQEDLARAMAVGLTAGGGYIFVNSTSQSKINGLHPQIYPPGNVYQKIRTSMSCLQPAHQIGSKEIKFLQVARNFLDPQPNQQQNQVPKFIFKIRLKPLAARIFYIQRRIKSNKFSTSVFNREKGKIVQVYEEGIYELIMKRYQATVGRDLKKRCPTCVGLALREIKLTTQVTVEEGYDQYDEPILRHRNSTILAITSSKYEPELVSKVSKELTALKIPKFMCRPYKKYTISSQRMIWFISHDCEFSFLNKIITEQDSENKGTCIIVTHFLQIRGALDHEKKSRFENIFIQIFGCQFLYECRLEKADDNPKSTKQIMSAYCRFQDAKQAAFAYIYLDSQGVKSCFFVKEYNFKNEHK